MEKTMRTNRRLAAYALAAACPLELPAAGDQAALLGGTVDAALEVWLTDSSGTLIEVLGAGTVKRSNTARVRLTRRLEAGEYVAVVDLDNGYEELPLEVEP